MQKIYVKSCIYTFFVVTFYLALLEQLYYSNFGSPYLKAGSSLIYVRTVVQAAISWAKKNTAYAGIDEFFCPKPCKFEKIVVIL